MSYTSDLDVGPFLDKFSEPEYVAAFWTLVISWVAYSLTKLVGAWVWDRMKGAIVGKEESAPDPKKLDKRLREVETATEKNWNSLVDHFGKHSGLETNEAGARAGLGERLGVVEKAVSEAKLPGDLLARLNGHDKSLVAAHMTLNELSCKVRDLMDAQLEGAVNMDDDSQDAKPDPIKLSPLAVALIDQIGKAKLAIWKEKDNEPTVNGMVTPNGLRIAVLCSGHIIKSSFLTIQDSRGMDIGNLLPDQDRTEVTEHAAARQTALRSIELDRQRAEAVAALTLPPVQLDISTGPVGVLRQAASPTPYHPGKTIQAASKGFEAVVDAHEYALPMPHCVPSAAVPDTLRRDKKA